MPFIDIAVAGAEIAPAARRELIAETTRLMREVLGKRQEVTAVRLTQVDAGLWGIGGLPLDEGSGVTVHMDVKITQGTNSAPEKQAMVAAGHALLRRLFPQAAEASYVIIHELPPEAWGYDGLSQMERIKARLPSRAML